ncbi:hypothetical protein PQQ84_35275 [Paraburkholderia strydomiana]|uniref:hypothetical protein n=1 Tax=Paraburkholderia strydomiana TaxID=1245417 RepID=UPI0038B97288
MLPDKRIADLPGYEGDVLIAKANRWYEQTYGDQLKGDFVYGFAPARLGNSVWRVRAALTYGKVRLFADRNLQKKGNTFAGGAMAGEASANILTSVDGLTQGVADRLPDSALHEHMEFHLLMHEALQWRDHLPNTELLGMARHDYDECTSAVLARRYGQARWAAEQAVEKTLKGLLKIGRTAFPSGGKNGHSLAHVAQLLEDNHGVSLNSAMLALAECSPAVRYGEQPSTEAQALAANHAVLGVLYQLCRSGHAQALLSTCQEPAK